MENIKKLLTFPRIQVERNQQARVKLEELLNEPVLEADFYRISTGYFCEWVNQRYDDFMFQKENYRNYPLI